MSNTAGIQIGKAIFNILINNGNLLSIVGMNANKIQPYPMLDQVDPVIGCTYKINSCSPVNVKRLYRIETAPLYNVNFTIECIHRDYSQSVIMADAVTRALQEVNGTFNNIKVNGFNLDGYQEDYNKQRKYYSKLISFEARVLL